MRNPVSMDKVNTFCCLWKEQSLKLNGNLWRYNKLPWEYCVSLGNAHLAIWSNMCSVTPSKGLMHPVTQKKYFSLFYIFPTKLNTIITQTNKEITLFCAEVYFLIGICLYYFLILLDGHSQWISASDWTHMLCMLHIILNLLS